jgi:hypothetical protein
MHHSKMSSGTPASAGARRADTTIPPRRGDMASKDPDADKLFHKLVKEASKHVAVAECAKAGIPDSVQRFLAS